MVVLIHSLSDCLKDNQREGQMNLEEVNPDESIEVEDFQVYLLSPTERTANVSNRLIFSPLLTRSFSAKQDSL